MKKKVQGQFWYFKKMLGVPTIMLDAPSNTQLATGCATLNVSEIAFGHYALLLHCK